MLSPPARVAVRATSNSVRRGLAALIRASPSFELVESSAELVLLELEPGETLSLDASPVLVLAGRPPRPTELSRVRGWIPADLDEEDILAALEAVARGLIVLHPDLAAASEPDSETLTARERELLSLLADGLANKEMAGRLGISEHTVKFHLSSIFTKLDANSRTEAVTAAIRRGLILI
ncbi:MAG: hypothetical protein AMXMBFR33_20230 [Candidatus Xenobia bacterium]